MDRISIKNARQQFAKLLTAAQRGRSVTITRRGKPVAKIGPVGPSEQRQFPDLTEFRASLGKRSKSSRANIEKLRDLERY